MAIWDSSVCIVSVALSPRTQALRIWKIIIELNIELYACVEAEHGFKVHSDKQQSF